MSAHTPGPWVLSGTWPASVVIGNEVIGLGQTPEGEANARLIAAAPDLLGALCSILSNPDSQLSKADREAARAAIAKAEGAQ